LNAIQLVWWRIAARSSVDERAVTERWDRGVEEAFDPS
jgi:hypothetical protein